jgi:hypothetical protein
MSTVYLHLGLAKTGTTSIQHALHGCAPALAEAGVLVPGSRRALRKALYDRLGRRVKADDQQVPGAWRRLVAEIDAWPGSAAIVSEELLALARPAQARRLLKDLAAHEVVVVVGLRGLAGLLPSAWQFEVQQGRTFTWREFVDAVKDPASGPPTAGVAFWLRQDVLRILDTWEGIVPRSSVRLVTVPTGSPASELLDRFARACDLPAGSLVSDEPVRNRGLGPAEVEVLRRLNVSVKGELTRPEQLSLNRLIGDALRSADADRLVLSPSDAAWAVERMTELGATLAERDYRVEGTWDDLTAAATAGRAPDEFSDEELADATDRALAALAVAVARRRGRRRAEPETEAGVGDRVVSSARAVAFRARVEALERADHNPMLASASRMYLNRISRRRS